MPGTDMPLEALNTYLGSCPCPTDFGNFWKQVWEEVKSLELEPRLEPVELGNPDVRSYRVSIQAPDGVTLQAKYLFCAEGTGFPGVVTFHDYPGGSRGWFHLSRYPAIGRAVLAPDCRGQGGASGNGIAGPGPMAYGPMFNGLEGNVKELYLFQLIRDALLWIRVASLLPQIDPDRISVCGDGQGGGLAIACAAIHLGIEKCAAHYPMLCDYKRVWDKDFGTNGYDGLAFFFRWHDPLHQREQEIFDKLAYVDVKNFAPLVRCPVLMSTGLQDTVSPPSAQFAVFHALQGEKRHLIYPKHGHELNNFYENELLAFLL